MPASLTTERVILHQGWLEKKGGDTYIDANNVLVKKRNFAKGGRRNWKQRWFVLYSDGQLAYGEDQASTSTSPKGSVWLFNRATGACCSWHLAEASGDGCGGSDEMLLSLPPQPDGTSVERTNHEAFLGFSTI
eukprot:COSAG05_NODE_2515_length_2955_cov_2.717787_2_plen_133_part_00